MKAVNRNRKKALEGFMIIGGLLFITSLWLFAKLEGFSTGNEEIRAFIWVTHFIMLGTAGFLAWVTVKAKWPLDKCAFLTVLFIGLIFMAVITPLSPPDEGRHYKVSYELSNYLLFRDRSAGNSADFDFHDLVIHENVSSGYERIMHEIWQPRASGEEITTETWLISYPLMYLPQALGLALGRLCGANFLILFYLGRLFNHLFYSFCVYFAVKRAPKHQALFFAAGMLPMALHQASSYSYDAFTNGMSLLLISLIYAAMRNEKPMGGKEYGALLAVGAFQAPAKVGYALIAVMLFLIPKERFEKLQKKAAVWGIILVMTLMIAVFWVPSLLSGNAVNYRYEELYTLEDIKARPLKVFEIFASTMEDSISGWIRQAVGVTYSGMTIWIPEYISVICLVLMALMALNQHGDTVAIINKKERFVILAIVFLCLIATMFVEFITWTPRSALRIEGVQGRYFIPLIPLVFLAAENRKVLREKHLEDRTILTVFLLMQVFTVDHIMVLTKLQ